MTPETRELLRLTLLQLAAASAATGQTLESYRLGAKLRGLGCEKKAVAAELQYLHDKGLLAPIGKTVSPEVARWRITAAGRDYLATEGLD